MKDDDTHLLIRKLLTVEGAGRIVRSHRWRNEADRKHELVVALFTRALPIADFESRNLADYLRSLGLLDLSKWIDDPDDKERKPVTIVKKRALEEVKGKGIKASDASRLVDLLTELASIVQRFGGGKVQVMLREAAEAALSELLKTLDLKSLPAAKTREAVIFWLQNVASFPISLEHETKTAFCKEAGVSPKDLLRAADDLNVNVVVLDDLILNWSIAKNRKSSPKKNKK